MPFEVFQRQRVAPQQEPAITIQRKGVFSMNVAAHRALGAPEAVELLYDPEERLVGIRKADPEEPHAYVVRGLGRGRVDTTFLVSGTAFTNYYAIDTTVSRRWTAHVDEDSENMLVLDLKEPGTEVFGNRGRSSREGAASPTADQGSLLNSSLPVGGVDA